MPEAPDYSVQLPDFSIDGEGVDPNGAAAQLQKAKAEGRIPEMDLDLTIFTAPQEPNTSFMVKGGKVISFPDPNSPSGRRDVEREGDILAVFVSGICATRDPEVIEWCEAHSGIPELHKIYHEEHGSSARECSVDIGLCRNLEHASTPGWAEMKALQQPTSRRSAFISANMDLDKLFAAGSPAMEAGAVGNAMETAGKAAQAADRQRTRGR